MARALKNVLQKEESITLVGIKWFLNLETN